MDRRGSIPLTHSLTHSHTHTHWVYVSVDALGFAGREYQVLASEGDDPWFILPSQQLGDTVRIQPTAGDDVASCQQRLRGGDKVL